MARAVRLALLSSALFALACVATACSSHPSALPARAPKLESARIAQRAEPLPFIGHGAGTRRIDATRD